MPSPEAAVDAAAPAGAGEAEPPPPPQQPQAFERLVRKFWVKPGEERWLIAQFARHLPVLFPFEKAGKFGRAEWLPAAALDDPARRERAIEDVLRRSTQRIHSVYLDDPARTVYGRRLLRDDKSRLIRVRWYQRPGEEHRRPEALFLERKTHNEAWRGEASVKERCTVDDAEVAALLAGRPVPDRAALGRSPGAAALLGEMEAFVLRGETGAPLTPSVRTLYRRIAFQDAHCNAVRVSLDLDLHMVQEAGRTDPAAGGGWCRSVDPLVSLPPGDVHRFPCAVLEVKLQDRNPAWLDGVLRSDKVVAVPKFSKFLHGTAVLNLPTTRKFPWWFVPEDPGRKRSPFAPATFDEMSDEYDKYLEQGDEWAFKTTHAQDASLSASEADTGSSGSDADGGSDSGGGLRQALPRSLSVDSHQLADEQPHVVAVAPPAAAEPLTPAGSTRVSLEALVSPRNPIAYAKQYLARRRAFATSASFGDNTYRAFAATPTGKTTKRSAAIVRTRVEPKTFFANERTFLSWLQVSVIIMFLAFALLEGSSFGGSPFVSGNGGGALHANSSMAMAARISGALMGPVALVFMMYALYIYRQRTFQILRRETVRYDDQRGPIMLVLALVAVCSVAYGLGLSMIFLERPTAVAAGGAGRYVAPPAPVAAPEEPRDIFEFWDALENANEGLGKSDDRRR